MQYKLGTSIYGYEIVFNLISVYSSQRALMALLLAMIVTEDNDDDDSGVSENVFTVSGKKKTINLALPGVHPQ